VVRLIRRSRLVRTYQVRGARRVRVHVDVLVVLLPLAPSARRVGGANVVVWVGVLLRRGRHRVAARVVALGGRDGHWVWARVGRFFLRRGGHRVGVRGFLGRDSHRRDARELLFLLLSWLQWRSGRRGRRFFKLERPDRAVGAEAHGHVAGVAPHRQVFRQKKSTRPSTGHPTPGRPA